MMRSAVLALAFPAEHDEAQRQRVVLALAFVAFGIALRRFHGLPAEAEPGANERLVELVKHYRRAPL